MIEYLYNAIRANSGEDVNISASVVDTEVEGNCYIRLMDENRNEIFKDKGTFLENYYIFIIPELITKELHGRYLYMFEDDNRSLSFPQAIYFE